MRYWVYLEGRILGPYSAQELPLQIPEFSPGTLLCPEGSSGEQEGDWRRAESFVELKDLFYVKSAVGSSGELPAEEGISAAGLNPMDPGPFFEESLPEISFHEQYRSSIQEIEVKNALFQKTHHKLDQLENRLLETQSLFTSHREHTKKALEKTRQALEELQTQISQGSVRLKESLNLDEKFRSLESDLNRKLELQLEQTTALEARIKQLTEINDRQADEIASLKQEKDKGAFSKGFALPKLNLAGDTALKKKSAEAPQIERQEQAAIAPEEASEVPAPFAGDFPELTLEESKQLQDETLLQPSGTALEDAQASAAAETAADLPTAGASEEFFAPPALETFTGRFQDIAFEEAPPSPEIAREAPYDFMRLLELKSEPFLKQSQAFVPAPASPAPAEPPPPEAAPAAAPVPEEAGQTLSFMGQPIDENSPLAFQMPRLEPVKPQLPESEPLAESAGRPPAPAADRGAPPDAPIKAEPAVQSPPELPEWNLPETVFSPPPSPQFSGVSGSQPPSLVPIEAGGPQAAAAPVSTTPPGGQAPAAGEREKAQTAVPAQIKKPPAKSPEAPKPAPKKKSKNFVLGVLLAMVGCLFVTLYLFLKDTEKMEINSLIPAMTGFQESPPPARNIPPAAVPAVSKVSQQPPEISSPASPEQLPQKLPPQAPETQTAPAAPALSSRREFISDDIRKAIDFVKNHPLDSGRGTIEKWLNSSFLNSPRDGHNAGWSAVPLGDAKTFMVRFEVSKANSATNGTIIQAKYIFEVDLRKKTISGTSPSARDLLKGMASPAPLTPADPKPSKSRGRKVKPAAPPVSAAQKPPENKAMPGISDTAEETSDELSSDELPAGEGDDYLPEEPSE
ncbi:MAG: hypothetical protein HY611_05595 [Elusimicrobia bacterium]|nr:hypothetical protein [Elusimicrobiota bacterium]